MAKAFDFQMLVIFVTLTIWVSGTTQELILNKLHSYEVGLTQLFGKLENFSIHQIFN